LDTTFRQLISQDWITALLLVCLILVTLARTRHTHRFTDLLRIFQTETFFSGTKKEISYWHPLHLLLTLLQVLSIPLFIYILYCYYQGWPVASKPFVYIQILVAYIVFFGVKNGLEYSVIWILNLRPHLSIYTFKKFTYRNVFGILLFVLSTFLVYTSSNNTIMIYLAVGIFGLLFLISLINFMASYRSQIIVYPFYFILYFCALELAPYYLVFKTIGI
jgi:hypothetical protein